MRAVLGCAATTATALSGLMVVLPLYAKARLEMTNAQYAQALSLRMVGIAIGVIVMGALSDRFGPKRLTLVCLPLAGAMFAAMAFVPLGGFLVVLPVLSGLLSTAFVNLNHLTQWVDHSRQGRANSLYRAVGIVAAMVTPVGATQLLAATGLYWPIFCIIGAALVAGAVALRAYPLEEPSVAFRGWREEFRSLGRTYLAAARQRPLLAYLNVLLGLGALAAAMSTFMAIRLTRELGAPATFYGNVRAAGEALALVAVLAVGRVLDRLPVKWCTVVPAAVIAAAMLAAGLASTALAAAACYVAHIVASNTSLGPTSIWLSRESGQAGLSAAFALHKVLMALYAAVGTLLFAFLEPHIGITGVFLACGALSVPLLVGLALLREPARSLAPAALPRAARPQPAE